MISARNVYKKYVSNGENRHILQGVDLEIDKGEFCVIAGRSGAGKSTLLHLLAGLDIPDRGQCLIGETVINDLDDEERAGIRLGNIGFVFQTFNFLGSLRIRDNIMIPAILLGKQPETATSEHMEHLAALLGIEHVLEQLPSEVSGGELQRACIARAMINNPGVILADEPTGNLDTANREKVIGSFKRIKNEFEVTILVVTHDEDIESDSDRVFHLKDGTIRES